MRGQAEYVACELLDLAAQLPSGEAERVPRDEIEARERATRPKKKHYQLHTGEHLCWEGSHEMALALQPFYCEECDAYWSGAMGDFSIYERPA